MYPITSTFGEIDGVHRFAHRGIDFAFPMDSTVRAFANGIVERITRTGDLGNAVWIKLQDGYRVVYGHLDHILVRVGDHVASRSVLGDSGNTGRSTGPHLHVGVIDPRGNFVDPAKYADVQQITDPSIVVGMPWADATVQRYVGQLFDAILKSAGNGVLFLLAHSPEIATGALVVAGFLKMFGSHVLFSRAIFVAGGAALACIVSH